MSNKSICMSSERTVQGADLPYKGPSSFLLAGLALCRLFLQGCHHMAVPVLVLGQEEEQRAGKGIPTSLPKELKHCTFSTSGPRLIWFVVDVI